MTRLPYLTRQEKLGLVLVAVSIVLALVDVVRARTPSDDRPGDAQLLGERELQRLEEGGSITVSRWHGGELVLEAEEVVVSVPSVDEDGEE